MSEKKHSKNSKKFILLGILVIAALCVLFVMIFVINTLSSVYRIIRKEVKIEVGTESVSVDDFIIKKDVAGDVSLITDLESIDLLVPGTYAVEFKYDGDVVKSTLRVVDTTAPVAEPADVIAFKNIDISPESLVENIKDFSPVTVTLDDKSFLTAVGKYDVTVVLTDKYSNSSSVTVPVTVVEDKGAPVIEGVKNLYAEVGGTINYRNGITVTDDFDKNAKLSVMSDDVDISKEGIYEVIYVATDASGNTSKVTAKVLVNNITTDDTESIDKAVDMAEKILDEIIKDGMTTKEKVTEIYRWARYNLIYAGSTDKSSYRVAAYKTLNTYSGDCYGYFAVTKLMFELLDIPNIDVVKVKNYEKDSRHFWSLVSIDDGSSYYHFDATPRKGDGDDFCLVTDAFLDAYSDAHDKCHNRDKSLYPATPTEEVS